MSDSSDLLKTQKELKNYLKSNKPPRQAHMMEEFSFLHPQITPSLQNATPPTPTMFLADLQSQIAQIKKQPEWSELIAVAQPVVNNISIVNNITVVNNFSLPIETLYTVQANPGLLDKLDKLTRALLTICTLEHQFALSDKLRNMLNITLETIDKILSSLQQP